MPEQLFSQATTLITHTYTQKHTSFICVPISKHLPTHTKPPGVALQTLRSYHSTTTYLFQTLTKHIALPLNPVELLLPLAGRRSLCNSLFYISVPHLLSYILYISPPPPSSISTSPPLPPPLLLTPHPSPSVPGASLTDCLSSPLNYIA